MFDLSRQFIISMDQVYHLEFLWFDHSRNGSMNDRKSKWKKGKIQQNILHFISMNSFAGYFFRSSLSIFYFFIFLNCKLCYILLELLMIAFFCALRFSTISPRYINYVWKSYVNEFSECWCFVYHLHSMSYIAF